MSRKYGSLNVSQPYGPPWPVTGIDLSLTLYTDLFPILYSTRKIRGRVIKSFTTILCSSDDDVY
jgi:hypothetical protein